MVLEHSCCFYLYTKNTHDRKLEWVPEFKDAFDTIIPRHMN